MAYTTKGSTIRWGTSQRPSVNPRPERHWQLGDIAFLKRSDDFSPLERAELLESRRVHAGATGHPVIILDRSNDSRYYIVTTVSAYSSGADNGYLAPWKREAHRHKDINGFRAFEGSAKPNDNFQHLRLANNMSWPKKETSWVYALVAYLVPASTLIHYDKSRARLRMEPSSLQDLLGHMEAECAGFRAQKKEIRAKSMANQPVAKRYEQSWRRDEKENRQGQSVPVAREPLRSITNVPPAMNTSAGKPRWSTVASKSISAVANLECQNNGHSQTPACRPRFIVLRRGG
ncbi:hypothetical protein F4802DRAFT_620233 [Xylaria palmicola]|nr:hypothetical protein F4802DRAFT_620233 [Xylaria palmicola]